MTTGAASRVAIVVATILTGAVMAYGVLQAEQDLSGAANTAVLHVAASTPTVVAILQPSPAPARLTGSDILIQVRGGDDPCRYLYTANRVGTFTGGQIVLVFVAGTHDAALAATDEMHLYGDTGPHLFEIEDADGGVILTVPVGRGDTVRATVVFPATGPYKLYDRHLDQPGHVSEIFARPVGEAGFVPVTDWCP